MQPLMAHSNPAEQEVWAVVVIGSGIELSRARCVSLSACLCCCWLECDLWSRGGNVCLLEPLPFGGPRKCGQHGISREDSTPRRAPSPPPPPARRCLRIRGPCAVRALLVCFEVRVCVFLLFSCRFFLQIVEGLHCGRACVQCLPVF